MEIKSIDVPFKEVAVLVWRAHLAVVVLAAAWGVLLWLIWQIASWGLTGPVVALV